MAGRNRVDQKEAAFVDNSISPVVSHNDEASSEALSEQKELVEDVLEKDEKESNAPVPEHHEEARQPRIGRRPILPTKAEIDEHFPLHLNYRSWCEHCVAGKARQSQLRAEPHDREKLGITFSADDALMSAEDIEEDMKSTLVMYDDDKGAFWAIGVEIKGASESIVKCVKGVLDQSGYEGQRMTSKADE